jgi:RNA polymerase sigma-70 factor (ECF subfamily)
MTDPLQFEAFMKSYQNMVFTTAVRLLGSESDAQDIAQEVFLKAYEHYSMLSQSPTAGGWLKTVARNLSLNHLTRYRGRWRFFSEMAREDENGGDYEASLASDSETDRGAIQADQREMLEQALAGLPESQRVPLVLYHFEEMSYDEIVARLRISLSKLKTDMHRGREALRRKLRIRMKDELELENEH